MRYAMKLAKLIRGQKGQATISAAMILLLIGGILIPPCLGFAVVSLKASQSGEQVLMGRYAADAGVEAAICKIKDGNLSVPAYYFLDEINDRNVDVTIQDKGDGIYKIISTATSDSGGNATVECYVLNIAGFNFFDSAITSNGNVTIQPGNNITGNVTANGTVDNKGDVNGTVNESATIDWPSELQLSTWYSDQVKDLEPFPYSDIDVKDTPSIGPLYREGNLNIDNTGGAGAVLNLTGTIYVTGNFECKQAGVKNYTINLNNQTIFCEGDISVSDSCTIIGSGCIIAVGDVYFTPQGDVGSEDDFVFIMSVEGTVTLQPGGDFYGAIAGDADITLQPGNTLTLTAVGEGDINFPIEGMGMMKVLSYTIK